MLTNRRCQGNWSKTTALLIEEELLNYLRSDGLGKQITLGHLASNVFQ